MVLTRLTPKKVLVEEEACFIEDWDYLASARRIEREAFSALGPLCGSVTTMVLLFITELLKL